MIDLTAETMSAKILQQLGQRAESLLVLLPNESESVPEVYWARNRLSVEELPGAVVTPGAESAERKYGVDVMTREVTISLVCLVGNHNPLDLSEVLLGGLKTQIPGDDMTLGGLAQDMTYSGGGVIDYPERDEQGLSVYATFEVEYHTEINNPNQGA
jgi:hypothetical protein